MLELNTEKEGFMAYTAPEDAQRPSEAAYGDVYSNFTCSFVHVANVFHCTYHKTIFF